MTKLQVQSEGRQWPLVAACRFTFADLDGTSFVPVIELPPNHLLVGLQLGVDAEADDDATMDIGIATDTDSLLAAVPVGDYLDVDEVTEIDGKGITAVSTAADLGYSAPRAGEVIGVTPSAELTAGSFCLVAKYIVFGRGHTTES